MCLHVYDDDDDDNDGGGGIYVHSTHVETRGQS